jgi:hypothetical protein
MQPRTRNRAVRLFVALAFLFARAGLGAQPTQQNVELQVDVRSSSMPAEMVLQQEGALDVLPLKRSGDGTVYSISLPRPTEKELTDSTRLFQSYVLVAGWQDGREQVYLAIRSTISETFRLRVYHESLSPERKTLEVIESLGVDDVHSLLEKYFKARAYHRKWRFELGQPRHQVAVRSARMWFDASYKLATVRDSYFRMDEEVLRYMREYQQAAGTSAEFGKVLRTYAPGGYVQAMEEQAFAANYRFVGKIPQLVAARRYEEAVQSNAKAIAVLSNETPEMQRIVAKHQGVNLQLLKSNAAFLATKVEK